MDRFKRTLRNRLEAEICIMDSNKLQSDVMKIQFVLVTLHGCKNHQSSVKIVWNALYGLFVVFVKPLCTNINSIITEVGLFWTLRDVNKNYELWKNK